MTPLQARLLEPAIAVHVAAALAALALGALVLLGRKGTRGHVLAGRAWVAAMALAAGGSFLIDARLLGVATPLGTFGPIHALSAFTLWQLARAVSSIRRRDVAVHRRAMTGAFAGLAVAGAFALVPGRTLGAWLLAAVG